MQNKQIEGNAAQLHTWLQLWHRYDPLHCTTLNCHYASYYQNLRAVRYHTYINGFCKDGFFVLFSLEKQLLRCWNSQFRVNTVIF